MLEFNQIVYLLFSFDLEHKPEASEKAARYGHEAVGLAKIDGAHLDRCAARAC